MRRTTIALLAALLVAGCAGGATKPAGESATRGTSSPVPSAAPAAAAAPDLLLARRGGRLVVLDSGNLQRLFDLPAGVGTPDWLTVYATAPEGAETTVSRHRVDHGGGADLQQTLQGHFAPATIGQGGATTGLSADGRTLVLVDQAPPAGRTRLAVLSTALDTPAKIVSLPGELTYDTMSPDGLILYLVEHLAPEAGGAYVVRSYDVAKGALDPGIVVAKNDSGEAMAGTPIEQVAGKAGWVFTLYLGPDGPFVHALSTVDRVALCLDLPVPAGAHSASAGWGLTADPERTVMYAANATLGRVFQLDPSGPALVRSADLATGAGSTVTLAKFDGAPGAIGRTVALSPDASTLYVVADAGILVLSTADLRQRAHLLADQAIAGIGVSADGRGLYVLGVDGRISVVDATTGVPLGAFDGTGYDAILRVVAATR